MYPDQLRAQTTKAYETLQPGCGQTEAKPFRSHDQTKTLSQRFTEGGIAAIRAEIEAECEAKYMDSLEAVQKSHQERLDYVTGERDQARKIAFAERQRAATAEDRANSAYLDHLKHCAKPIVITCDEVNYLKQIADLEKQLAEKTSSNDLGWNRAMEVSEKCDKALNKIDAIKKFLDSRRADGFTSFVMQTIENILGGN